MSTGNRRSFALNALLAVSCSLTSGLAAWATDLTQVTGVHSDASAEQITLSLSGKNQATLVSPLERKQRLLVLDIKNATLENLPDKAVLLSKIQTQLTKDVTEITLDEFRGTEPRVRMVVKTKDPNITGALIQGEGETIVLQLLQTGAVQSASAKPLANGPQSAPVQTKASQIEDLEPTVVTLAAPAGAATPSDSKPDTVLKAQTSKMSAEKALERKSNEAERLRNERNELEGQVGNLQQTLESQRQMMVNVREQQERLLTQYDQRPERARIEALQAQLQSLQESYDVVRQTVSDYEKKVETLQTELKAREQHLASMEQQWKDSGKILLPEDATSRAGLINTLDTLTKPDVNALLDAEKAYREAQKALVSKQYTRAEMLLQQAVQGSPQVPAYAVALAECYSAQKRYEKAQGVLQTALKRHPEDMGILNELGKLSLTQNDPQGALGYFQKAFPAGLLSNYASTLKRLNRLQDAENLMALAVDTHPRDSDLQFNLGSFYLTQKRFNDAKGRFMEAVKLKPDFAEAYYNLGVTYGQLGQYDLAKSALQNYLKLAPQAANKSTVESYIQDIETMQPKVQ